MGEKYERRKARRDVLLNRLTDAYREADKLIITVSSGVLALSVAFFNRTNLPKSIEALRLAWVVLPLTVLIVLVSLLLEQRDRRRRITELDNGKMDTDGCLDGVLHFLNVAAVVLFMIGLGALSWFLVGNTL